MQPVNTFLDIATKLSQCVKDVLLECAGRNKEKSTMVLLTRVKTKLGSNSTDYPPTAITSQWGGQTFLDHWKKCSSDAEET